MLSHAHYLHVHADMCLQVAPSSGSGAQFGENLNPPHLLKFDVFLTNLIQKMYEVLKINSGQKLFERREDIRHVEGPIEAQLTTGTMVVRENLTK